jgi:hypothetical protein
MAKQTTWKVLLTTALLTAGIVNGTPFGSKSPQTPFNLPQDNLRSSVSTSRNAAMEYAMKTLTGVSSQVVETFETVMGELSDVSKHLTWSLPEKAVKPRPEGWAYTVSSAALPEHALRVKKPDRLGVDDVKQVISGLAEKVNFSMLDIWTSVTLSISFIGSLKVAMILRKTPLSFGSTEVC